MFHANASFPAVYLNNFLSKLRSNYFFLIIIRRLAIIQGVFVSFAQSIPFQISHVKHGTWTYLGTILILCQMFKPGMIVQTCALRIVLAPSGLGLITNILLTQQSSTNATSRMENQAWHQSLVSFLEFQDAHMVRNLINQQKVPKIRIIHYIQPLSPIHKNLTIYIQNSFF